MKSFEILKKIIETIKKNISINIYKSFSSQIVTLPIDKKFVTAEIYSGSEDKTLITITTYSPKKEGPQGCTDLTKKIIDILSQSKLENFSGIDMQQIKYDNTKNAYVQKCNVIFKMPKIITTEIMFGNEKIIAKDNLSISVSRNYSVYNSQIIGAKFNDLGCSLKKVCGTAVIDKDQFTRLCEIISDKFIKKLSVEGQSFYAALVSLERKLKGETYFSFLEVKNEY